MRGTTGGRAVATSQRGAPLAYWRSKPYPKAFGERQAPRALGETGASGIPPGHVRLKPAGREDFVLLDSHRSPECGRGRSIVALNRYDTPSLQNEQKGIAHLARGLVHAFRNVTAHEPQVVRHISEEDALDMMSVASLILRRLDGATVTTAYQPVP